MIAVARVAELLRGAGAVAPMAPPMLAIVDHADNSGATASIAGVELGASVIVYVEHFAGHLGAGAWQFVGARTGNGNLELNLPVGHYFGYAVSSLGAGLAISNVVYFVVSDGLESIHTRCLEAAQARIRLLALPDLSSANVLVEKVPTARNVSRSVDGFPAVVLSPHRAAMPATEGTNGLDDVHYDVLVTLLDRDNQEPTLAANIDRHLLWRQRIARAFRNQRLPGVDEVIDTVVEPAVGPDPQSWKQEYLTSSVLLRFVSRERRGF